MGRVWEIIKLVIIFNLLKHECELPGPLFISIFLNFSKYCVVVSMEY